MCPLAVTVTTALPVLQREATPMPGRIRKLSSKAFPGIYMIHVIRLGAEDIIQDTSCQLIIADRHTETTNAARRQKKDLGKGTMKGETVVPPALSPLLLLQILISKHIYRADTDDITMPK